MTDIAIAYIKYQFAGLWPLLWHFGLGGVIVISSFSRQHFYLAFFRTSKERCFGLPPLSYPSWFQLE